MNFCISGAKTSESSKGDIPDSKSTLRILLAEDDPINQKVTMIMLEHLGYYAKAVSNGKEALQEIENQDYDLVLMDVKMPEVDGLQATQIIRRRHPRNSPMIIAFTAYALNGDKEKCLDAGMDGYLAKPVTLNDLRAAIASCAKQTNYIDNRSLDSPIVRFASQQIGI